MFYPGIHEWTRHDDINRKTRSRFAKNNLVRRIVGVMRADKRRTGGLRVEIGVKESVMKTLVRSALIFDMGWSCGKNGRLNKLAKRAASIMWKEEGCEEN